MSKTWMLTAERHPERESIEEVKILQWIIKHDVHDWIVAKETGDFGYKHWQIRMRTNLSFEQMQEAFPRAHIEEASNVYDYERKDGNFYCSNDTVETQRVRFGELRPNQRRILDEADKTDDRSIICVVDKNGCTGKTWLSVYLYEKSLGYYTPPTISTSQGIIQHIASGYKGERYIVIDIPRSTRWTNQLYVAVETIKDGLVYDTRYHSTIRNIRGAKVIVFCNTKPNVSKLSLDRWRLLGPNGLPIEPSKRNTKEGSIPLGIEDP